MMRRVVVTGIGVVSCAGSDAASFRASVFAGKTCLSPAADARYKPATGVMAGRVSTPLLSLPGSWPAMDRFVHLALTAANQALCHSGVSPDKLTWRMGVVLGTCSGPTNTIEEFYQATMKGTADRQPVQSLRMSYSSAARTLAHVFNIGGFNGTVTTACSAGLTAIGTGMDLIRSGLLDAVLAGGADAYSISTQTGFDGLKAPSDGACAPFSKPVGLSLGEGAAMLVLEAMEPALARGAPILAEILGFGTSNDAHHCSSPDPAGHGQSLAVIRALGDAGVAREAVSYVNAHGTGTAANDKAETKAIHRVFGSAAAGIPVSSQKGVFGHTLGAAGAMETIATILGRQEGVFPPTANFSIRREGCDLDYIPDAGRPWSRAGVWVKESFAFGGHNASLVLGPPPETVTPVVEVVHKVPIRACIAGMGVVSPGGAGLDAFRQLILEPKPRMNDCQVPGHGLIRAATVPDSIPQDLERRLGLKRMDRASAWATTAAYMAMTHGGVSMRPDVTSEVGLFIGHSSASNPAETSYITGLLENDYAIQSVADFPFVVPNAMVGTLCRTLGLRGHDAAFCFGASAGLMSLILGAIAIENGHAPFMLVGSVDALAQRAWSDFCPSGGEPLAEGAVFFLLEAEDHLRARGARPWARVEGAAFASAAGAGWDAFPSDTTVRDTLDRALRQAGLRVEDIGHVCSHTGSIAGFNALAGHANVVDTARHMGWAEAGSDLFDIVACLSAPPESDIWRSRRAILGGFSSRQGSTAALVVRPISGTGTNA